jgi:hypothetical protein
MRSVMLINKRLATNCWESLSFDSSDVMAICLISEFGQTCIFNIYNDCTCSHTLTCLEQFILTPVAPPITLNAQTSDIWLGDFNRHDSLWESPNNSQLFSTANLDAAEILINRLVDFSMDIALDPGIPTLEHMVTKNLH